MRRNASTGIVLATIFTLVMTIAAILPVNNPADATSSNPIYGAEQLAGQLNASDQIEYRYRAEDIKEIPISDEYALKLLEQVFGSEIAACAKHRVATPAQSDYEDNSVRYTEQYSLNWCGYQVVDVRATAVRADFNVCKTSGTYTADATWVGLGNPNVIQTGVTMDSELPFQAWYELLPAPPVYLFDVNKGDEIHACVQLDIYMGGLYYVAIVDATTGDWFASEFSYQPERCAEWIVETPFGPNGQYYIGHFGTESFSDAYWWNSWNPYITYGVDQGASWFHITEITTRGEVLIASPPGPDHRSFSVTH